MYDASAKIPSGILSGNLNQYGDFTMCLNVLSEDEEIRGKYCLASIQFHVPKENEFLNRLRQQILAFEPYVNNFDDVSYFEIRQKV